MGPKRHGMDQWYVGITFSMDIDGTVSVMPVFLFLPRWADRRHRKWDVGVGGITVAWLSSLINDWFVLVRLFHSSSKLDSMQILE